METLHNSASFVESDEEDYEIYFLQPASSPYNIKEKLEKANRELFEENLDLSSRPLRIKFREELVEYEPDLTDDDVQSIESYNETIDYNFIEHHSQDDSFPYNIPTKLELNIFPPSTVNVDEEDDEEEDQDETILKEDSVDAEQVNEEIEDDEEDLNQEIQEDDDVSEEIISDEVSENEINGSNTSDTAEEEIEECDFNVETTRKRTSTTKSSATISKNSSPSQSKSGKLHIDCKAHCIEQLELKLPINKLKVSEKPACPALKLQKRKCCEKNHVKNEQKLPYYTGLRSEYGLSLAQMEKKERRKELTKLREEKRRQLLEEYKQRKIQQNEEIFRQWLKNIEKRRLEQAKKTADNNKKCLSPTIFNFPSRDKIKERPKTTNNALPNRNIKRRRRPHTTSACVFIEVPSSYLKHGIQVGDLLVAKSGGNMPTKNLHLLTFS